MAEFCPDCPLRGMCTEEIACVEGGSFEHNYLNKGIIIAKWEDRYVTISECVDVDGGRSELFIGVDPETIQPRVETCEGPIDSRVTSIIPFRKPKIVKVCGALGVRPNVPFMYEDHYREEQKRIAGTEES